MSATPSTPSRRVGFTLIELLVVISIIGVLVGLLLPAVNSAREAARRTHCVNNLFQIGAAIQNYESTHEVLPPGVVDTAGPISNVEKGYHVSWIVQILPFIEQKNAFNKTNFRRGVYDPANATVRGHELAVFVCPDDPSPRVTNGVAFSSYAACHHDSEAPIDVTNNGVFYLNSRTRYDDVTDGTSNTLFVGEKKPLRPDFGWMSGTRATLRNVGSGTPVGVLGGDPGYDDALNEAAGDAGIPPHLFVGRFSSNHPGGANFLLGDGSVRFIRASISNSLFRRLANRADGELIEASGF